MDPIVEPRQPGSVPWRWVSIGPDGQRRHGVRWSRPWASAVDIADEVMAVLAAKILKEDGRPDRLAECVVQVVRPEHDGWPAQYGESRGRSWLAEVGERTATRAVQDPGRAA